MTPPLEAIVMGRAGVDLYPMQLETRLEDVDGFHKYAGGFAANVATGLARLGVRAADHLGGRRRRPRPLRAQFSRGRGRGLPLAGGAPHAAHRARILRGLAARQLPDHVLPHPHLPRLGARARRPRSARDRRRPAALRERHRPRARAVAAGDDGGRRGAPRGGRDDRARPRLALDAVGRPGRLRGRRAGMRAHGRRRARVRRGDRGRRRRDRPGPDPRARAERARAEARARRRDGAHARRRERADRAPPGRRHKRARGGRCLRRRVRLAAASRRHPGAGCGGREPGRRTRRRRGWDAPSRCREKETSCERADAEGARARRHPSRSRLALALVPVRARRWPQRARDRGRRGVPGQPGRGARGGRGRRPPQPGRARDAVRRPAPLALPAARDDLCPRGQRPRRRVRGAGRRRPSCAPDPARGGAGRGARIRQRHPPDQPHHPPRVPRPPAAGGRGADPGRQLVVVPAAQARGGAAAGRERPRGGLRLPVRAARGLRGAAALQPHRRPRRDLDRARRRRAARAARLPPVLRGARLPRLLPERARRRGAVDGGARTIPTWRGRATAGRRCSATRVFP